MKVLDRIAGWFGRGAPVAYGRQANVGEGVSWADGQPPFDAFALPHVLTYASILGSGWRTYWHDKWDEAWRHSREDALVMRNDCFLMGLLQERKLAVASLNWHLEVPDENDPVQKQTRDAMTEILKGVRGLNRLKYSLLDAIWYGRYGVQLLWEWRDYDGRRVLTVRDWRPVNGDKIGHTFDGTPYVLVNAAFADRIPSAEFVPTTYYKGLLLKGSWRERFVIHKHLVDDADFMDAEAAESLYGVGVRSRVFWLDWLRREYLAWLTDYMERVGLGLTLWFYEDGNKQSKSSAEQAAKQQTNRTNVLWPRSSLGPGKGSGVERIETPGTGAAILIEMQKHIEDVIERYIVGQTLSSGTEGSGLGGSGVADLHADTKLKIAAMDASNLAETLTGNDAEPGLVSVIQRCSFPETTPDRPNGFAVRWVFDVERADSKEKLEAGKAIVEMGVPVKADELRAAAGLSKPGPHDEVVGQVPAAEGGQTDRLAESLAGGGEDERAPVPFSRDAEGNEHAPPGSPGGGRFVKKGGGSGAGGAGGAGASSQRKPIAKNPADELPSARDLAEHKRGEKGKEIGKKADKKLERFSAGVLGLGLGASVSSTSDLSGRVGGCYNLMACKLVGGKDGKVAIQRRTRENANVEAAKHFADSKGEATFRSVLAYNIAGANALPEGFYWYPGNTGRKLQEKMLLRDRDGRTITFADVRDGKGQAELKTAVVKQIKKHKGEALKMAKESTEKTIADAGKRYGKQLVAGKQLGVDPKKIKVPDAVRDHVLAGASAEELRAALAKIEGKK